MAVKDDEVPNSEKERRLAALHAALGYKRLSRTWGKCEIVIGLFAAGLGLFSGGMIPFFRLALFVFGGYLVLAGHRNHLYQSSNELTAYLTELIRSMNDKGKRE